MGVPLARRGKALDEVGAAIDSLQLVVFPCNIPYFQDIKKEARSPLDFGYEKEIRQ
jgi:hypothetical protein